MCQVVSKASQFQPQNISNIAWAFASWNHQPSRAMSAKMESHLVEHMPQYTAQVRWLLLASREMSMQLIRC